MASFPEWMYSYDGVYERVAKAAEGLVGSSFSTDGEFIAKVLEEAGFYTGVIPSTEYINLIKGYITGEIGSNNVNVHSNVIGSNGWNPNTPAKDSYDYSVRGAIYKIYLSSGTTYGICLERVEKTTLTWIPQFCYLENGTVVKNGVNFISSVLYPYSENSNIQAYDVFQNNGTEPTFSSNNPIFENALKRLNNKEYLYTFPSWNEYSDSYRDGKYDNSWEFVRDVLIDSGYTDLPDVGTKPGNIQSWLYKNAEDYKALKNNTADVQAGDIIIVGGYREAQENHDPIFSIAMGSFTCGEENGSTSSALQPWFYRAASYPYYIDGTTEYNGNTFGVYTFLGCVNFIHLSRSNLVSRYAGGGYSYYRARLKKKETAFEHKVYYYYGDPVFGGELKGARVTKTSDTTAHVVLPTEVPAGSSGAGEKFVSATVNLRSYTTNEFDVSILPNQTTMSITAYYNSYENNGHKWLIYI